MAVRAHELPSPVNVAVPEGYCDEPPYSARTGEFRGYYSFGFERDRFTPCDAESLNLSENTFFDEPRIGTIFRSGRRDLKEGSLYFLDLKGTLAGPGIEGFLTLDYLLWVDDVLIAHEVQTEDCDRDVPKARTQRILGR